MLIFGIQQVWKHLAVMDIGGCHYISTNKAMININADAVLVPIIVDAILFDPAVTARKDDAPAADQAAINNVAAVTPFFVGGGLIQTTSG